MEESRKQFEEEFEKQTGWEAEDYPNYDYVDSLWRIWQASRQAVEIDITPQPERVIFGYAGTGPDDYYDTIEIARSRDDRSADGSEPMEIYLEWQVKEALRAAGLRVKGE